MLTSNVHTEGIVDDLSSQRSGVTTPQVVYWKHDAALKRSTALKLILSIHPADSGAYQEQDNPAMPGRKFLVHVYSCEQLSDFRCGPSVVDVSDDLDPAIRDQALYVNRAIYNIHEFFVRFSNKIESVLEKQSTDLDKILSTYADTDSDEIASAATLLSQLSLPMTLGLSVANVTLPLLPTFVGTETAPANLLSNQLTAWNNPEIAPIARLWSSAIRAAPKVQEILWSRNPAANAQNQSLETNRPIGNNIDDLIQEALKHIMSDIRSFLAFAAEGRFASNYNPEFPSELDIAAGINTFVLSKLMQKAEMYAVPGPIVNKTTYEAFDAANERSVSFWSPSTQRQYELRAKNHGKIKPRTLLDDVVDRGLADPQLLFDGNYNCTWAGWAGESIVNRVGVVGGGDVACLSQLPMYLEKGTPCPTDVRVGGKCPFGYLG
ncbi:MAG: hypothetical protein Q9177_003632 [Variospora cf. flavescens]